MNRSIYNFFEDVITTRLSEVKYVGLFRNQFTNVGKDRPIDYPAILVQIDPLTFKQLQGCVQTSKMSVTLHVGMQIVNNIERGDKTVDNSWDYLDLMDRVWDAFDGINSFEEFSGSTADNVDINNMYRTTQNIDVNLKSIWYSKVTFEFQMQVCHTESTWVDHTLDEMNVSYSGITF